MNILEELALSAQAITDKKKEEKSLETVKQEALSLPKSDFRFEKNLDRPGISFICELKKASPSKGLISEEFDYLKYAHDYESNGASAISCLTEPTKFLGSLEYLNNVSSEIDLPVLRKDFIVDPYQIYEAKINGASAVLLIVSLLSEDTIKEFIKIADSLGLSSLVEVHDEEELQKALNSGARVVGVNNRNLKDFTVDFNNSIRLADKIPDSVIFVSESGIHSRDDIKKLEEAGVDAVLIGEQLMKSNDIPKALKELMYDEN